MVNQRRSCCILLIAVCMIAASAAEAQQAGGIRGTITDKDFEAPLPAAQVTIVETGEKVTATEEGDYLFEWVEPGAYTLLFAKEGYAQQLKSAVVVEPGQLTEVNVGMSGEFVEMEEFVVQDVQLKAGSEAALLKLRLESPALLDSVGSELISQAGASDAASALTLVSGATVAEGKYAVVRGLPDRYVNSQMNGVRLPTADADKRAVELDLFPASAIESIQVSKTFTPDQQGDASGGAVNIVLKHIPDEWLLNLDVGYGWNTLVEEDENDFLTYRGGGFDYWGRDDGDRDVQTENIGRNWDGAVGVSEDHAPYDYKWALALGGKYEFYRGIKFGGFGSFFYDRDSSYYNDGIDDQYWVEEPGAQLTPQFSQGTPEQGDFKTSLFDITRGSQEVKWGGLGILGLETKLHKLSLLYLYTKVAEDAATLAEDTRGKEYFFPGYDPDDPTHPGNQQQQAAPYLRLETLNYTERTAQTLQLFGEHVIPLPEFGIDGVFTVLEPEIGWYVAHSLARLFEPDKRQFGSLWFAERFNPGFPPFVPPFTTPATHLPFKPAANFTLGNLQRITREIEEESDQYAIDLKLPFEQWTGDKGYLKFGVFNDEVTREYDQDSFSNFNDNTARFIGDFDEFWSAEFPGEDHPITEAEIDVDYEGEQRISAWYYMADVPLTSFFRVIGGVRYEDTELSIVNFPEEEVTWVPPGAAGLVRLNPGDADVQFEQSDELPAIGVVITPLEQLKLYAAYSETVARQTFKELTPILQQEFLGGDVFIGNPLLEMSAVENYDLRLDFTPFDGSLLSVSWFKKDITEPIEYVQRLAGFVYTTPVNYPEGKLSGYEFEISQQLGELWNPLEGLTLRANATLIDSEVTLPAEEIEGFEQENIRAPMRTRDMTNAPEYLYNLALTYQLDKLKIPGLKDTKIGIFYTVRGDTLVAGAGQSNGNFVPSVYEREYGSLNLSIVKWFGEHLAIKFQAKNVNDPLIETVYRSEFIENDVTKTAYRKGIDFSLGLTFAF